MLRDDVTFEEYGHVYRVNDVVERSVTQVLEAAGISDFSGVPPDILRFAQERGTAVHAATHYDDEGALDEATVDPVIGGYLEGWRKFRRDKRFNPREIEKLVYRRVSFAGADARVPAENDVVVIGRFDREGYVPMLRDAIIDIKSGEEAESWPVQLAPYVRAFSRTAQWTHERVVVQLRRNGDYKTFVYPRADFDHDWLRFRDAAISLRRAA